jgi:hypothetical protein
MLLAGVGCSSSDHPKARSETAPTQPSQLTAAAKQTVRWVVANGGHIVTDDPTGWIASKLVWRGPWPWSSNDAVMGCYGSTGGPIATLVNFESGNYLIDGPPSLLTSQGAYFDGMASERTTNRQVAVTWAAHIRTLCPNHD